MNRKNNQILQWLLSIVFFCETVVAFAQPVQAAVHGAGVDGLGRPVVQGAVPQRIVSLQPALTEVVCALGECQRLVGVDRYSSWPAEVIAALPEVGGGPRTSIFAFGKAGLTWFHVLLGFGMKPPLPSGTSLASAR